jgi:Flp pilus assembly protein TadG
MIMKNKVEQKMPGFIWLDSGAVAPLAALLMTVFLGFMAFAIDIGHLTLVKSEMQRTADATALAGARGLFPDNLSPDTNPDSLLNYIPNINQANSRASSTLAKNVVDGQSLNLESGEVSLEAGTYTYSDNKFTPTPVASTSTNAYRVMITNHPVNHFFAQVLGYANSKVNVKAVAVMDYVLGMPPGTLPIAVNKKELPLQVNTNLIIDFNPTPTNSGAWFSVLPDAASAQTFTSYIEQGSCPSLQVGQDINCSTGVDTSVLRALSAAMNRSGGAPWDVYLPVVDTSPFDLNKTLPIKSFVHFRINVVDVNGNNKRVEGMVLAMGLPCPGSTPGGPNAGLLAPVKLVAYE